MQLNRKEMEVRKGLRVWEKTSVLREWKILRIDGNNIFKVARKIRN